MIFFYNIIIHIVYFFLQIIALFNPKIKLFVHGRKKTFDKLKIITKEDRVFWVHAASLGEFEQGRPIIEKLKSNYPNHKIVLTFFSPSGYEIRKNYDLADVVCYLPFDSKRRVQKFIQQTHPELAIIVKYEFWPNLLNQLQKNNTKTILVSGIFREEQLFFKSYGKWMRKFLNTFDHFFVQNENSKKLLNHINKTNVTVSGDTRFDRVFEILQQDNTLDFINDFKNNNYTIVAGSTWKEDEELIVNYINTHASDNEKFIIAPHKIDKENIEELRKTILKKTILYSERNNVNLTEYQVFIIDTIGLLTKIYSYANTAYIGGGLATGLHNILEPATFGVPIVFGANKYQKFQEANDLIDLGGAKTVLSKEDFTTIFTALKNNLDTRIKMGKILKEYVQNNIGASDLILEYIKRSV
ncbi:3-deoxy-D-manno-octulosonic acid transferase [Tenacibaculum agarivorans]|uniref:3-deoxy-D-manno-octulosonic acid transferase n=1 Tax=Tenacibaculum agarivorans TaxID=1908389 RepID=UPI00094BC635|nr:glycosyltransferase N-terminal domain-containing protein [Tenacibaculum agarivorans]